jgi:hypothetical protein
VNTATEVVPVLCSQLVELCATHVLRLARRLIAVMVSFKSVNNVTLLLLVVDSPLVASVQLPQVLVYLVLVVPVLVRSIIVVMEK